MGAEMLDSRGSFLSSSFTVNSFVYLSYYTDTLRLVLARGSAEVLARRAIKSASGVCRLRKPTPIICTTAPTEYLPLLRSDLFSFLRTTYTVATYRPMPQSFTYSCPSEVWFLSLIYCSLTYWCRSIIPIRYSIQSFTYSCPSEYYSYYD
jgi:hypothetical protein